MYQALFQQFTYFNSFNPTTTLEGRYYNYLHFTKEETGIEIFSKLIKVTHLVSGGVGILIQVV